MKLINVTPPTFPKKQEKYFKTLQNNVAITVVIALHSYQQIQNETRKSTAVSHYFFVVANTRVVFIYFNPGSITIPEQFIDEFFPKYLSINGLVYDERTGLTPPSLVK